MTRTSAPAVSAGEAAPPRDDRSARRSVRARVADEIGRRIVRGDYPPGTILPNEMEWAGTFGVSRAIVREAMKMLMAKNLLATRQKVGSWVEPREDWNLLDRDVLGWYAEMPDPTAFLRSVQEFRLFIEPEAAALAAVRRTEPQLEAIELACAAMAAAPSLAERAAADTRFHVAILRAAGNELLMPLGSLIGSAFDFLFTVATREADDLGHAQDLHEAIADAIRRRRPEAARRAVRRLLANTDRLIGALPRE